MDHSFRSRGRLYRLTRGGEEPHGGVVESTQARSLLVELLQDPAAAHAIRRAVAEHARGPSQLPTRELARWLAVAVDRGDLVLHERVSPRRAPTRPPHPAKEIEDPFADAPVAERRPAPAAAPAPAQASEAVEAEVADEPAENEPEVRAEPQPESPPPLEEDDDVETDEPKLVSIQWLEGDDSTLAAGPVDQWVNLDRDAKWVDGKNVPSLDRLGQKPRLLVKFDKPGASAFKLRLVPGPENATYSGAELGRNPKFAQTTEELSFTTEGDGTKIVDGDVVVPCSGRDVYQAEAEDDHGIKRRSTSLVTRRLLFVQQVKMANEDGEVLAATTPDLRAMETVLANHGIAVELLPDMTMPHHENIGSPDESAAFGEDARAAYVASPATTAKEPHVLCVAYTDHLAVKDSNLVVRKEGVQTYFDLPHPTLPIVDASGSPRALWKDLVDGEGWFVSGTFQKDGQEHITEIDERMCTPVPSPLNPSAFTSVQVGRNWLGEGRGTLTLTVNVVNRMRGGVAMAGNVCVVCTRAWWKDKLASGQQQVAIHEIGHQLGLTPDGTGSGPDAPANQYTDHGHRGSHCHTGLALADAFSVERGGCVMFGSTNTVSTFCGECVPGIRKVDLSGGWPRF